MTPAIFVDSVDGSKYGLTAGWQQLSFPDNSLFPFCVGGSMSTPSLGYVQNEANKWGFGNFSFDGVGLSLMGMVDFSTFPPNRALPHYVDTIGSVLDGGEMQLHNLTTPYKTHMQNLYSTGVITDGQHLLNITQIPVGFGWDWAAIAPGPNQAVRDETLVVDDIDDLIVYNGKWELSQEVFEVGTILERNFTYHHSGYGTSVHITRTVNDTLQFPFTGSSISIYGFWRWDVPGNIKATIQIDNMDVQTISFPINTTSPVILNQTLYQVHTQPNFEIYASSPIPPGDHILTMNITEVNGEQSLIIDTLRYRASFDTLNSMPNITVPSLNPEPTPSPSFGGSKVGAIVGGVIGGVAFLVILALFGLWIIRRRKRRDEESAAVAAPFVAEKAALPPDVPATALVFDDLDSQRGEITSKRRNFDNAHHSSAASINNSSVPSSPRPPGAAAPTVPGAVVTQEVAAEEEERRVQELERAVQRAARENEFLVQGQAAPPAYGDDHS